MTVNTNVISIFVSSQPGDSASLQGGLSVQILPSTAYLAGCMKHQFAAFIRDRAMLVVWDDDPEKLIEHTTRLETLLMVTVWNDGANYADEEKELTTERIDELTGLEKLEEGLGYDPPRRTMLLSPFIVSGTLLLIMVCLGSGWRKLALEVMVDGSYTRLALAAASPIIFFVCLVSFDVAVDTPLLTYVVHDAIYCRLLVSDDRPSPSDDDQHQCILGQAATTTHKWNFPSYHESNACVQGGSKYCYPAHYNVHQSGNFNV